MFLLHLFSLAAKTVNVPKVTMPDNFIDEAQVVELQAEFLVSKGSDGALVEHQGRKLATKDKSKVKEIVNLFTKYNAPPNDIKEIIDSLKYVKVDPYEELKKGEKSFIIFFIDDTSFDKPLLHTVNGFTVFVSTDDELAKALDISVPGIYGFNAVDKAEYRLSLDGDNSSAIAIVSTSVIGVISQYNYPLYKATGLPVFYIIADSSSFANLTSELTPPAMRFKELARFVFLAYSPGSIQLEHYGLEKEDLPAMVHLTEDGRYRKPKIASDNLVSFVSGVFEKTEEMFHLSEEEPEDNKSRAVKTIVHGNIKTYLEDSSKDRLIVFSLPSCKYCNELKPILKELGEYVASKKLDNIIIGDCDISKNDIPGFIIKSAPTIYLLKADDPDQDKNKDEDKKVLYTEGSRTLDSLIEFIKAKSTYKLEPRAKVRDEL